VHVVLCTGQIIILSAVLAQINK